MKRKISIVFALILVLALFVSCETTVKMRTLVPATVNLASYDRVGVVSTETVSHFPGENYIKLVLNVDYHDSCTDFFAKELGTYRFGLSESIARYASNVVTLAVREGSSSFLDTYYTDTIIRDARKRGQTVKSAFSENGIDAVITSKITEQDLNERLDIKPYFIKDESGNEILCYKLYLVRDAKLTLSYSLIDIKTNSVVYSDSLSDSESLSYYIGRREGDGLFENSLAFYTREDSTDVFKRILDKIGNQITKDFSQSYQYSFFALQSSDSPEIQRGIELANCEYYEEALNAFLPVWEKTKSFESGYNAAVMYFCLRDYDKALELSFNVWTNTMDSKAKRLYERILNLSSKDIKAKEQLGLIESIPREEELVGF